MDKSGAEIEKRRYQAKHVLNRVRKESQGARTTTLKRTAAMLQSPYTEHSRNGLVYINFDVDEIATLDANKDDVEKNKAKKQKHVKNEEEAASMDGEEDQVREDSFEDGIFGEVIPEEEYNQDDDDDIGGLDDDE